jgi:hypothetical protein
MGETVVNMLLMKTVSGMMRGRGREGRERERERVRESDREGMRTERSQSFNWSPR